MIVLSPNKDKTLFIQQYDKGRNWLVAGYVNKGESAEEAVKRELFEEIGIKVKDDSIRLIDSYRDEHFFRDVYLIKDNITLNSIKFNDGEVADAKYVTIEEFKEMLQKNEINSWNESFIKLYRKMINDN